MKMENFKKIVELQHSFNILAMGENYLDLSLNWNSAIIAESGEMLDSLGYKWWKKQEVDIENAKVEAIDLLHFVISKRLQFFFNKGKDINVSKRVVIQNFICSFDDESLKIITLEESNLFLLIDELCSSRLNNFTVLKEIFKKLEMTNEDVYIAYIVKNCLNKFRADNGYKDGTYIKDWNGKEDNVVAYTIAEEWGADNELFEHLYIDLETYYNEEVKNV